jgi:hypothetical protein
MHLALFFAAFVAALFGILMLAFGGTRFLAPLAANPLIVAAVTWLLGALLLIILGTMSARLRRLADAIDAQRMPRTFATLPPPPSPHHDEITAPSPSLSAVDKPEAAPRDLLPDPASVVPAPPVASGGEPPPAAVAPPIIAVAPAMDAVPSGRPATWPRVDPSDRIVPQASPPSEPAAWDADTAADEPRPDAVVPVLSPPVALKSGVIEGMAYTLYSDGSVEADLPVGIVHFASIAEWRAHMQAHA